jgi:hypothetical protein
LISAFTPSSLGGEAGGCLEKKNQQLKSVSKTMQVSNRSPILNNKFPKFNSNDRSALKKRRKDNPLGSQYKKAMQPVF